MPSIYKTAEGRAAVLALYERRLAASPIPVESRTVQTRFGSTHLLVAGPAEAPALVVVHGAHGSAMDMVEAMGRLARANRCYFLDVPGGPNRSAETLLPKSGDALARWMEDVLAALKLDRVAALGMSGGGMVALKCCSVIPERLTRVVLIVPEGLARPRVLPFLVRILLPIVRYQRRPREKTLRRITAALTGPAGAEVPPAVLEQLSLALQHLASGTELAPLFKPGEFARLEAPVFLVAAGRDLVFPGQAVIDRARAIVPTLRRTILLPEAGHIHPSLVADEVMALVEGFLREPARDQGVG